MSKPAANPFVENEFTKYFDVSKVIELPRAFQDLKVQGFSFESFMESQRKNMQAVAAAQQTAAEGIQTIMRRQSDIMRQAMQESSSLLSEVIATSTPEEKIAKQTELAKTVFDRVIQNGKELAEMTTKAQYEALAVLSNRLGECLQEMRGVTRAPVPTTGKPVANK